MGLGGKIVRGIFKGTERRSPFSGTPLNGRKLLERDAVTQGRPKPERPRGFCDFILAFFWHVVGSPLYGSGRKPFTSYIRTSFKFAPLTYSATLLALVRGGDAFLRVA